MFQTPSRMQGRTQQSSQQPSAKTDMTPVQTESRRHSTNGVDTSAITPFDKNRNSSSTTKMDIEITAATQQRTYSITEQRDLIKNSQQNLQLSLDLLKKYSSASDHQIEDMKSKTPLLNTWTTPSSKQESEPQSLHSTHKSSSTMKLYPTDLSKQRPASASTRPQSKGIERKSSKDRVEASSQSKQLSLSDQKYHEYIKGLDKHGAKMRNYERAMQLTQSESRRSHSKPTVDVPASTSYAKS